MFTWCVITPNQYAAYNRTRVYTPFLSYYRLHVNETTKHNKVCIHVHYVSLGMLYICVRAHLCFVVFNMLQSQGIPRKGGVYNIGYKLSSNRFNTARIMLCK